VKRILLLTLMVVVALGIGFDFGVHAASKSYQFTGVVKSNDGGQLTVEKSAKETWTFDTNKDTRGTAKVGDKVTVSYTMIATQIENKAAAAKPAASAAKPAAAAAKKK
jgi:hypothetical protein